MLEAPEALVIAGQVGRDLKGKKVSDVIVGYTPHKFTFCNGDTEYFSDALLGRTITGARAAGGMPVIELGKTILVFSDGANITYHPPGENLPKKFQFLLAFDDESCITSSTRMYGGILCYPEGIPVGKLNEYYISSATKPQVMGEEFTLEYFRSLASGEGMEKKSAKAFLATESRIPGLGNGVLQDILYNAGIHPKTRMERIDATALEKLYGHVVTTLREMYDSGGRETESDIYGNYGNYKLWLSKYTVGGDCPRCGSVIMKEAYMGGSIYYCPGCQPWVR